MRQWITSLIGMALLLSANTVHADVITTAADGTIVTMPQAEPAIDPVILQKATQAKARRKARRNAPTRAAKTWTVGTGTSYADINAAMDVCDDGDIIKVKAGTTMTDDQTIYKSVTIEGPGWTLDSNGKLTDGVACCQANVMVMAESVRITGMVFDDMPMSGYSTSSYIYIMDDGITIDHCHTKAGIGVRSNYEASDVTLRQNFIADQIDGYSINANFGWTIHNNIIASPVVSSSGREINVICRLYAATIDHNIIDSHITTTGYNLSGLSHCDISNNVITHFTAVSQAGTGAYADNMTALTSVNTFTRNVFTGNAPATNNKGGISTRNEVYLFSGMFNSSLDQHYRIKSGSPASGYATDGTDCGPWGGTTPYEGGGGETPQPVQPMNGDNYVLSVNHADGTDFGTTYYQTLLSFFTDIDKRGVANSATSSLGMAGILVNVVPATYPFEINATTLPLLQSLWQKRNTFVEERNSVKAAIKREESKLVSTPEGEQTRPKVKSQNPMQTAATAADAPVLTVAEASKLIRIVAAGGQNAVFSFTASASMGISVETVKGYVRELVDVLSLQGITVLFNGVNIYEEPKQPVTKAQYTLTLPASPITYDGQPHPATVTVADGVGTPRIQYSPNLTSGTGFAYLTTDPPVEVGEYDVFLSISEGTKFLEMERTYVGTITIVSAVLLGDANTDGSVNVLDAQWTLRYILAPSETTPFSFQNANTYSTDQLINVQDIVCTVNIILAAPISIAELNPDVIPHPWLYAKGAYTPEAISVADGFPVGMPPAIPSATLIATPAAITLVAPGASPVAAIDLLLAGIAPDQLSLALPASDFQLVTRATDEGTRVIIISPTGCNIVEAAAEAPILLTSTAATPVAALAATPDAREVKVGFDTADGIAALRNSSPASSNGTTVNFPIVQSYTLSGQRLTAPRRGINVVGGRKVVVK